MQEDEEIQPTDHPLITAVDEQPVHCYHKKTYLSDAKVHVNNDRQVLVVSRAEPVKKPAGGGATENNPAMPMPPPEAPQQKNPTTFLESKTKCPKSIRNKRKAKDEGKDETKQKDIGLEEEEAIFSSNKKVKKEEPLSISTGNGVKGVIEEEEEVEEPESYTAMIPYPPNGGQLNLCLLPVNGVPIITDYSRGDISHKSSKAIRNLGDGVVSINGVHTLGMSLEEIIRLLQHSGELTGFIAMRLSNSRYREQLSNDLSSDLAAAAASAPSTSQSTTSRQRPSPIEHDRAIRRRHSSSSTKRGNNKKKKRTPSPAAMAAANTAAAWIAAEARRHQHHSHHHPHRRRGNGGTNPELDRSQIQIFSSSQTTTARARARSAAAQPSAIAVASATRRLLPPAPPPAQPAQGPTNLFHPLIHPRRDRNTGYDELSSRELTNSAGVPLFQQEAAGAKAAVRSSSPFPPFLHDHHPNHSLVPQPKGKR